MDDPLTSWPDAAVVHTSQTQFVPGGQLTFGCVQSVMVLGCRDGTGEVEFNGVRRRLDPEDLVIAPWGHRVAYAADRHAPFLVYGLHVIPCHTRDRPVAFEIADVADHRLHDVAWRSPAGSPITSLVHTTVRERPRLAGLVDYALAVFTAGPTEAEARLLGSLACSELGQPARTPEVSIADLPSRISRLATWVQANLDGPIPIERLVELDASSPATITRLFRTHLGTSPGRWVARQRIELAQRYLITTTLTISQVARRVGFDDPYHFSRQFKTLTGRSPRAWRARHRL